MHTFNFQVGSEPQTWLFGSSSPTRISHHYRLKIQAVRQSRLDTSAGPARHPIAVFLLMLLRCIRYSLHLQDVQSHPVPTVHQLSNELSVPELIKLSIFTNKWILLIGYPCLKKYGFFRSKG